MIILQKTIFCYTVRTSSSSEVSSKMFARWRRTESQSASGIKYRSCTSERSEMNYAQPEKESLCPKTKSQPANNNWPGRISTTHIPPPPFHPLPSTIRIYKVMIVTVPSSWLNIMKVRRGTRNIIIFRESGAEPSNTQRLVDPGNR